MQCYIAVISPPTDLMRYAVNDTNNRVGFGSWFSTFIHDAAGYIVGAGNIPGSPATRHPDNSPPSQADIDAAVAKLQAANPTATNMGTIGGVPYDQAIMLVGFAFAVLILTGKKKGE